MTAHRVTILEHNKKRIIFINNNNSNREQSYENAVAFNDIVKKEPLNSALVLQDMENCAINNEAVALWKNNSAEFDKHIKKAALVGVTGLVKIVVLAYKTYTRLKGIKIEERLREFNTIEEAKDWLTKD